MTDWNIRFRFDDGASYEHVETDVSPDMVAGYWMEPFPNEKGNSLAFGLVESMSQSDIGAALCADHGDIIKVETSKPGDELNRLREETDSLRYQVRQLTRKQTNPDMMAVNFKAHENTWKMLEHDSRLNPWAEELWKDLQEARDAYQSLDNFHNWFKSDILTALDGAPELTDEESMSVEINNDWSYRIRKTVAEMQRLQKVVELASDPKLLKLAYEPGSDLEMAFEPNWAIKSMAYSFKDTFTKGGENGEAPPNYLSMVVQIPEDEIELEVIVQKVNGERPAAKATRYKAGLEGAWGLLNDWDFGRRGDSLDAETNAWVDAWKDEVGDGGK